MARATLRLPGGRRLEISGPESDKSVLGALVYSEGEWETHIQALFERLVQPDWECLDLGANIGVHTLNLASLASRVFAFEASIENFEFLVHNVRVAGLAEKVDPINKAVWREAGELQLFWSEGLAGCAHVMEDGSSDLGRAQLRSVVSNPFLEESLFAGTCRRVEAICLDDWADNIGLSRIDLVKIDVEGAEVGALQGARKMLARHAPLIVTEYNPACAKAYFNQPPSAYFTLLSEICEDIRIVLPGGIVSAPIGWSYLETYLARDAEWADLLCSVKGRGARFGVLGEHIGE